MMSRVELERRPYETSAIHVLENPEMPTMRAVAFTTPDGAFLFALSRDQMLKLAEMIVRELREMPNPS
jgi:hypothetical protein